MKALLFNLVMNLILITILVSLFSCCKSLIPPDDELTLTRQDYNGSELRIDGFFHHLNYTKDEGYYDIYFLYSNGVILYIGTISQSKVKNIDKYISSTEQNYKTGKTGLGIFIIQDSLIKFERWHPTSAFEPTPTYIREGKILNDTTFHITKIYRSKGTELIEVDEVYHFKQFSPKPDSTNIFIK